MPAIMNITMDSLSIIICLILLVSLLISGDGKSKSSRFFAVMLIVNLAILASSIVSMVFDGVSGTPARFLVIVSNFLLYLFWFIQRVSVSRYIIAYIGVSKKQARYYQWILVSFCTVMIVLLTFSQFNHMIYLIDTSNSFHRERFFWIAYTPILISIPDMIFVFLCRKKLRKSDMLVILNIGLIPPLAGFLQLFLHNILALNTAITFVLLILYVMIQIEQGKRLKQRELELQQSRIDMMLSQIQPHFLYNTLTAIKNLIDKDPVSAETLVEQFSLFLRQNMDALRQRTLIRFERELAHLQIYLNIEKTRFKERLTIVYDFEITDFFLPILTVQPIVENAVRHGVTKKIEGGTVTISTRTRGNDILVTITDDGAGFDPQAPKEDRRSHIGIENVRQRLDAQCGGKLVVESVPDAGTTVTIIIPSKRSETT